MSESRLEIPLPALGPRAALDPGSATSHARIVGILRQQGAQSGATSTSALDERSPPPRSIALILHGVLAHKDQLFHRKLAEQLPMDSFRFDFRHAVEGGESHEEARGPAWDMANFADDVIDMHVVVRYLRDKYNYHVEAIISHSRGTLDSWTYYWDVEQRRRGVISNRRDGFLLDRVPLYVAIAGRWDMTRMRQRKDVYGQQFREQGYYTWKARVGGKPVSVQITPDMVERFATFPIQDMVRSFPAACDVLIIHGDKDPTIPVEDAYAFKTHLDGMQTEAFARQERPSSTQLHIVKGADHTFKGHFDEVVDASCSWLRGRQRLAASKDAQASPEASAFLARLQTGDKAKVEGELLDQWSTETSLEDRPRTPSPGTNGASKL